MGKVKLWITAYSARLEFKTRRTDTGFKGFQNTRQRGLLMLEATEATGDLELQMWRLQTPYPKATVKGVKEKSLQLFLLRAWTW